MERVPNKSSEEDEQETKLQKLKKIIDKPRPSFQKDEVSSNDLVELRGD